MSVCNGYRCISMQIHCHDGVYDDCFSVLTDIRGGTNTAVEYAIALQARASGRKHKLDTDRQRCADMPWHHHCSLHAWKTVYTCGRQSTHVEDTLHAWKTVYTCGRHSTRLEDSLHMWKTVYKPALTKGKHTGALMKHCSSFGNSMMAPGDWLELSIKVEGGKGVDTLLHCFAHGWMAQDTPNLRCLHVLNRQTHYMP